MSDDDLAAALEDFKLSVEREEDGTFFLFLHVRGLRILTLDEHIEEEWAADITQAILLEAFSSQQLITATDRMLVYRGSISIAEEERCDLIAREVRCCVEERWSNLRWVLITRDLNKHYFILTESGKYQNVLKEPPIEKALLLTTGDVEERRTTLVQNGIEGWFWPVSGGGSDDPRYATSKNAMAEADDF